MFCSSRIGLARLIASRHSWTELEVPLQHWRRSHATARRRTVQTDEPGAAVHAAAEPQVRMQRSSHATIQGSMHVLPGVVA